MANTEDVKNIIEALLFVTSEPLKPREIREALGDNDPLTDGRIRKIMDALRDDYSTQRRSFTVTEIAGGYRLQTLPMFGKWVSRLRSAPSRRRLSTPATETLAIIAYRQPITKAEIEAIRGVNIDGVLENLVDRELVEAKGRKMAVGKPFLYGTSKKFLEHFGLRNLKELPQIEELKRPAKVQDPAEKEGGETAEDPGEGEDENRRVEE